MKNPRLNRFIIVSCLLASAAGCSLYRVEKDLSPSYAAFLSEARYLITASERKAFLSTPDGNKDQYIEEFWKRRDTDPNTPENELRTEYYARIAQADALFLTDMPKGWLSERGRIYILYGPPSERRKTTDRLRQDILMSSQYEYWSYGGYEVVFRDERGTGTYRLETQNLGPIEELNISRIGIPGRPGYPQGAGFAGRAPSNAKPTLDFTAELRDAVRANDRISALLRLEIPLPMIWFRSERGRFQTTFDVVIRMRDANKAVVWEKSAGASADYDMNGFAARSRESHAVEIPILIEEAEILARLAGAPPVLSVRLTNRTGSESVEKTVEWK